jgi:ABC-2 type transport system permease protein
MINYKIIGTIFIKEMRSFFNSTIAYILIVLFLALTGWFYVNNIFLINVASMRDLFSIIPLIFLFIVPAVTMRLFSEEKKTGTIELLTTKPIQDLEIVLGKFLAAWALIGITLLPTLFYFITIASLGSLDIGATIGGYIGLILMAAVYISLGIFASSLTENQIVAFIIGLAFTLVLYFCDKFLVFLPDWSASIIEYVGVDYHYTSIARGVIDSRDLIYFFSALGFSLYLTVLSLDRRKW